MLSVFQIYNRFLWHSGYFTHCFTIQNAFVDNLAQINFAKIFEPLLFVSFLIFAHFIKVPSLYACFNSHIPWHKRQIPAWICINFFWLLSPLSPDDTRHVSWLPGYSGCSCRVCASLTPGSVFRVEMSLKFSKNLTAHAHCCCCCCGGNDCLLLPGHCTIPDRLTVHLIPDHDWQLSYLCQIPNKSLIFSLNQYLDGS